MDALISSFLFQGTLNRRLLAHPAPAGSAECPSVPAPPRHRPPDQRLLFSGASSRPGSCPPVPRSTRAGLHLHPVSQASPARGARPAYTGALTAARKPSTCLRLCRRPEPRVSGPSLCKNGCLLLQPGAGSHRNPHVFRESQEEGLLSESPLSLPCSSNGHWLQVCAGQGALPHTGKTKMSYPGPPSSLGNGAVRQEGSCNLIQKVLVPREADSMQAEPKPDWDGGDPSVYIPPADTECLSWL